MQVYLRSLSLHSAVAAAVASDVGGSSNQQQQEPRGSSALSAAAAVAAAAAALMSPEPKPDLGNITLAQFQMLEESLRK